MATRDRPKGSKNKSHISLTNEDLAELQKMTRKEKAELDKLKNLIARQDDMIAQLQDDLRIEEDRSDKLEQEIEILEGYIDSFKTILITILEMDK